MNDIGFLKKLYFYKNDDKEDAEKAIMKFINHLWYLSEECAAFSIFDKRLSNDTRRKMAEKIMHGTPKKESQKKFILKYEDLQHFLSKKLPLDILGNNSKNIFEKFNMSTDFLKDQPDKWKEHEGYIEGKRVVESIKVVNDTVEQGVKLMTDFNEKFTKNEEQKQFVLQVVQDYRKKFPGCSKDTLKESYN
ncbi:uncharacterized protein LOC126909176 [Daktulosphaira vitifoliae]|uniref:uncharacterized protein LOC126909176 n=1 Tax=Daktulosphaira vitifoliae TaxID=58002 RepID=UPI0021A9A7F7|nr:uncharacterized protein LOC126909176 [Daktulosphaira vitifoliae]